MFIRLEQCCAHLSGQRRVFGFTAQVANNIAGLAGADLAETGRDWANRGIRAIEWPVLRHQ